MRPTAALLFPFALPQLLINATALPFSLRKWSFTAFESVKGRFITLKYFSPSLMHSSQRREPSLGFCNHDCWDTRVVGPLFPFRRPPRRACGENSLLHHHSKRLVIHRATAVKKRPFFVPHRHKRPPRHPPPLSTTFRSRFLGLQSLLLPEILPVFIRFGSKRLLKFGNSWGEMSFVTHSVGIPFSGELRCLDRTVIGSLVDSITPNGNYLLDSYLQRPISSLISFALLCTVYISPVNELWRPSFAPSKQGF